MSLGNRKARLVLEEYASLSCSHCARFHTEVFPAFRKKYIDTGRVRYVLHEFMTPPEQIAAAGWLIARCSGAKNYFSVVSAVFESQSRWAASTSVRPIFLKIAQDHGLTEAQFTACLSDRKAIDAVEARMNDGIKRGVEATPTFFLNGRKIEEGEVTLQELDAAIAAAGGRR